MRVKAGKATFKYFGTLIFLLFFFLKEAFPNAALAFTSLNACARSKECLELIKDSSSSAVSAPTGAGFGSSTLSTTTSSGAVRTLVKGVTDFAIVTAPTAAYVGWHYWNEAHNGRAQNRARELYCAAHLNDLVCKPFTGGQSNDVLYKFTLYYKYSPYEPAANYLYGNVVGPIEAVRTIKAPLPPGSGVGYVDVKVKRFPLGYYRGDGWWNAVRNSITEEFYAEIRDVQRMDNQPDTGGNPPPLPWKDWPQEKRDAAVALLNNSDWQRLITSMPFGSALDPGDTAKAPTIVIPGQEWDNPNTPLDDRRLKTVPGEYARPVVPDFDHDGDPDETDADDDNDGVIEPYDPEPRNPYVPRASSEPPPPPDDDTPPQSEGERSVSDVRDTHGDFLEKAENDVFENRLDTIEAKYKRAAAMEEQADTDPDVGFEQQRLVDEANNELQQLKDEIQQVWWSSLSQAEQQLFRSINSGDIDETRSHMEQWSAATFEQYAQTYEEAVARNILYYANDKGYSNPLEYLRAASNFDTARAVRTPTEPTQYREDDTARWENPNTKYFIVVDKEGKILTYGKNP